MSEEELRETIKIAIGYEPVPLSIRDHPEIRSEYRTAEDRDGLVDRITAALLPKLQADQVESVARIMARAHPAESLGNVAREIIQFLKLSESKEQQVRPEHTAWIPVDLMFRDRYNALVRHAPYMLVEVVKHGNEVLFQDAENGTHRMVALQHIENTRAAVEIEKKRILEETGL